MPTHTTAAVHLMPPVYDQGRAGSCTGNATAGALAYDWRRQGNAPFLPSRLMLYYDGRALEGTQDHDSGAAIRDVVRGSASPRVCDEAAWPYDLANLNVRPSQAAYGSIHHRAAVYEALPSQDIETIKQVIAAGYVVVFGFTVFASFMTAQVARTGLVPMPSGNVEGGHAVVACGYNSRDYVLFRNSWGTGWGDPDIPGYGWMPSAMISNPDMAADFWIIQTVS